MASPYLQSAIWLLGCGALGYGLLLATAPSDQKLEAIRLGSERQRSLDSDMQRRQQQLMDKLASTATAKPVYLKTPAELAADNQRAAAGGK